MRNVGTSGWAVAWAVLLLVGVLWVAFDHQSANQILDAVVGRLEMNRLLAAGIVVFGALNLFALAFRIVTWRNE